MCPYYLDGDLGESLAALPGDTRVIGYCAVFKVRGEANASRRGPGRVQRATGEEPVSQNSTACGPPRRPRLKGRGAVLPAGSVDVLVAGPWRASPRGPVPLEEAP